MDHFVQNVDVKMETKLGLVSSIMMHLDLLLLSHIFHVDPLWNVYLEVF